MFHWVLYKFFKVNPEENVKVFVFFLLGTLLYAGIILGLTVSDSLFLSVVGSEKLPIFFILMPITMFIVSPLYAQLINKFGCYKIFYFTLIYLFIGGIVLTIFSLLSNPYLYYLIKLYAYIILINGYSLYWSFVDEYFTILDAKRLYPLLSGSLTCGGIIGGAIIYYSNDLFNLNISYTYLFWSLLALISIPLLKYIYKKQPSLEKDKIQNKPLKALVHDIKKFDKKSNFILLINIILICLLFISTICEYQYSKIFEEGRTQEELIQLFAQLFLYTNIFNLFINFFVFNRLINIIGVRYVALIQPIIYFLVFTFLLIDQTDMSAYVAFWSYYGFLASIDNNNWNFLFNAIPGTFKKTVRIITEGLADPIGTALAGSFLFCFTIIFTIENSSLYILLTTLMICIILIILVLSLQNKYLKAMLENLKTESIDFAQEVKIFFKNISEKDVHLIANTFQTQKKTQFNISFFILWERNKDLTLDILLNLLIRIKMEEQNLLQPMFNIILNLENHNMSRKVIECVEQHNIQLSPYLLEEFGSYGLIQPKYLESLLNSPSFYKKSASVIALWNSWNMIDTVKSINELYNMLQDKNTDIIIAAIKIIGRMKQSKYAYFLVNYLDSPISKIRIVALEALKNIADTDTDKIIPNIIQVLLKREFNERLIALDILEKIKDANNIPKVIDSTFNLSPVEKRKVLNILLSIGLKSVPSLLKLFKDDALSYRSKAISARALSKLSFPQFDSSTSEIIFKEIDKAYLCLYYYSILNNKYNQNDDSTEQQIHLLVLAKLYKKKFEVILDFVLEILTLSGQLPNFDLIKNSLQSSNQKTRSNTIETLEQGVKHEFFKVLLPLVDSRHVQDKVSFFKKVHRKNTCADSKKYFKHNKVSDIIQAGLNTNLSIEKAICYEALWKEKQTDYLEVIMEGIKQDYKPICKNALLNLIKQQENPDIDSFLFQKLYYIFQSPLYNHLGIYEIQTLINDIKIISISNKYLYTTSEEATAFYINVESQVLDNRSLKAFELLGLEDCFTNKFYSSNLYIQEGKFVKVRKADILKYSKILPRLSLGILRILAEHHD